MESFLKQQRDEDLFQRRRNQKAVLASLQHSRLHNNEMFFSQQGIAIQNGISTKKKKKASINEGEQDTIYRSNQEKQIINELMGEEFRDLMTDEEPFNILNSHPKRRNNIATEQQLNKPVAIINPSPMNVSPHLQVPFIQSKALIERKVIQKSKKGSNAPNTEEQSEDEDKYMYSSRPAILKIRLPNENYFLDTCSQDEGGDFGEIQETQKYASKSKSSNEIPIQGVGDFSPLTKIQRHKITLNEKRQQIINDKKAIIANALSVKNIEIPSFFSVRDMQQPALRQEIRQLPIPSPLRLKAHYDDQSIGRCAQGQGSSRDQQPPIFTLKRVSGVNGLEIVGLNKSLQDHNQDEDLSMSSGNIDS